MLKPEPKPTSVVCTVCGLSWEKHYPPGLAVAARKKHAVTLEDCVRVLQAELAKRPNYQPYVQMTGTGMASAVGVPLYGNQIGKIS